MKLLLFVASLAFLIASAVAMDSINVGAHNNAIQATKRPIEKTDPSLKTKTGADASSVSLTAESTDKLPKKLELWGMYCSKMGDVAVVTKDLPGGFKCNDAALTAEQKNTLQKVITEAIAKEKSPEEAAKWQSEVETVKPVQDAPAPALSLLMLREQTRRAGHRVSTKVPTLPQYLWPRRTIPYCWEMGWHLWTKVLSWYGMRTIAAHTNMRFEKVACGAAGHKVKWQYVAGQALSCPAMVYHTAANPCTIFAVPAVPANTNPMPVPAPASTFQVLEYDSARGNSLTAAHEMLHNIGINHMHQRSDRDTYVKVGANKASANCAKVGAPFVDSAVTYNYDSIMHYGPTGTCKLAALKAKAKAHGDPANMGQRRRWVAVDTTIVNTLYPVAVPL